ncbi:hypothetical protein CALVIDRAFT_557242 [Calocera viscosa TUFC12733]|uniref:Uncharacterized protein n=1 Tax=Calocera viscosa (strain TUFC12733) TaxID=1330018 RepID=A0A167ITT0_CALVF|nr:hypothetical protein CALVIDRAFT_557242 [Calocera viscosa TUFC12733]
MIYAWDHRNTGTISLGLIGRLKSKYGLTMMDVKLAGKQKADYCDLWVYKRPSKDDVWGYREVFFIRRLLHGPMKAPQTLRNSDQQFADKLCQAGLKKMMFGMLEISYDERREIEKDQVVWQSEEWLADSSDSSEEER